ncbi:MAG: DNA polymerase III subunit chi [Burkholderiaceae bacterium]
MTDVAFHTGIADPLGYACRLLRKAYRAGARVAVHGEGPALDRLDQALWTFEPLEFVPHVLLPRDGADGGRLARTPIVLVKDGASAPSDCRVAVALGAHALADASAFDRVIAVVGQSPEQREAARQRWREYERAGHAMTHVAPAGGGAEG